MEATRARPTQTNTRPAPSAVQKSAGPSKAVVSVAGKAPLYTGAPAVRLGTPAPGPVTGLSQAEVSEQIGQLVNAPGTGEPLRPEIQKSLENSLEVDLSPVRVHTDERSAAVADNLNARAFTYGPHIFLGSRERQTDLALMAHEVTHVIQQQGAPVLQMSSAPAAPDTFEREAQQVSTTVQQGGQANVTGRTVGQQVQKEDVPWYKRAARAVGRGASAVGAAVVKGAEAVVEWGENVGWSLLNKYAPDLVPIIRQGVGEWLKEKISSAIETVFNTLMAPVRAVTGVVQSLMAHFTELLAWMREAASEIARGDCSAITKAVDKVQKVIEGIASPIIDRVKHLAQKVGDFFKGLWERFGAPIWDFLKKVGGAIWEKIQRFGNWVWEKTQPIRDLLGRAWKWIKDKLGVGDEPEGQNGLLQWFQKKAAAAWDWLKAKIEPIKKPLMVVAGVLVMLSPAGPIIAIGAAVGGLIMGIRWIRQHLNTPDGVVKNRGVLQGVIIPGIMNAVKGLTGKLSSIAASIIEKLNKVMGGLGDLVGAVGGSILRFAVSAVKWIADQFQGLVQWGSEKLHGLVDWISNGLHRLHVFLQPILDVLAKVGEVIVDILKLPGLIIGKVWKIIPACIRDPFVDFLINQILKRLPFFNQLTEIGEIWSKIKNGAMTAIRQVFKEGDLKGAMVTVFKLMLDLLKVPLQLVVAIFSKAGSVLDLIIANPKGFLINVLLALKEGFVNFFKNILTHLINGVIGWLTSELKDVNITVEGSLTDLWSIFKLVLQVLGLSVERVFERLGKKIGADKVEKLKKMFKVLSGVWDWITAVMTEGLVGLWKKIKEQLTNLYDLLLDSVIGWVTEKIIGEVTKQILSMLDPTGIMAVVKSIIALYRGIQSFLRYLTRMLQIINTILDSLLGLAKGEISPAAVLLEQAMDKAMPVVIGFLANQIGLGGIGKRIQEIIKKVHEKVDKAIDWLIDKAVNGGKAVLNSLGLGGGKPDKQVAEQKKQGKVGQEADLDEEGEHHHIWIDIATDSPKLMIESTPGPFDDFIVMLRKSASDIEETNSKMIKAAKAAKEKGEEAPKGIVESGKISTMWSELHLVERLAAKERSMRAGDPTLGELFLQLVDVFRRLIRSINESRQGLKLNAGKGISGGNIARATFNIVPSNNRLGPGISGSITAMSGSTTPMVPQRRYFETIPLPESERPTEFDSEVKILEEIAHRINREMRIQPDQENAEKYSGAYGQITLVSELTICDSCRGVIRQFREKFPNVRIDASATK